MWRAVLHKPTKNCRHRGSDEGNAPGLGDGEIEAGEGEVVIGGKQGDQAEDQAADRLDGTGLVEAKPGRLWWHPLWRKRSVIAAGLL